MNKAKNLLSLFESGESIEIETKDVLIEISGCRSLTTSPYGPGDEDKYEVSGSGAYFTILIKNKKAVKVRGFELD